MANTVSEWLLTLLPWAHFSKESASISSSRLEKPRQESTSIDSHTGTPRVLSPEEEIIIQMGKEYPSLFIA